MISIDYEEINNVFSSFFDKKVVDEDRRIWKAIDGKELRGSIDKVSGEKRGENIVLSTNHESKENDLLGFYSGKKESERTLVYDFVVAHPEPSGLKGQAFSLDALHNNMQLLKSINCRGGIFTTQVKGNQKFLTKDLQKIEEFKENEGTIESNDRGHGRIEKRIATFYIVTREDLDKRWKKAEISTFIKLVRQVENIKTGRQSEEIAYYVSNLEISESTKQELFDAIRNHWAVESNNYLRDKNFGEDRFKSFNVSLQQNISTLLTKGINLLKRYQKKLRQENLNILREELMYDQELVHELF